MCQDWHHWFAHAPGHGHFFGASTPRRTVSFAGDRSHQKNNYPIGDNSPGDVKISEGFVPSEHHGTVHRLRTEKKTHIFLAAKITGGNLENKQTVAAAGNNVRDKDLFLTCSAAHLK